MTGLQDVQGYSSSVPGTATASARLRGQIIRGCLIDEAHTAQIQKTNGTDAKFTKRESTAYHDERANEHGIHEEIARLREPRRLALQGTTVLVYCSSLAPVAWWRCTECVQRYGSMRMANLGFVMKNAVTSLHSCGSIFVVNTAPLKKANCPRLIMPEYPKAEQTRAAAVMVLRIAY